MLMLICVLQYFLLTFTSRAIVHASSVQNRSQIGKRDLSSSVGKSFQLLEGQLIDGLEKMQSAMVKKKLNCMPRSIFYNGSCIYISGKHEKLSWKRAERFCRKLPLNTSFLIIQNEHKMDFVRRELVRLREKELPTDQLQFYIGFNFSKSRDSFLFIRTFLYNSDY